MDFNNNGIDDLLKFEMFNDDSDGYSFKRRKIPLKSKQAQIC